VDQIIKENFKNVRALQAIVHGAIILEREHTLGPEQLKALLVSNIATKTNQKSANLGLRTITQSFGLTEEAIKGRGRSKQEIKARAVAAASLRRHGSSYGAIAALLGGRDRSTVRGLVLHGETLAANDNTVAELLIRS
jgi:chromosomal replication initiation ATPase DnaA